MTAQELADRITETHGEGLVSLFAEIRDEIGELPAEKLWAEACRVRNHP